MVSELLPQRCAQRTQRLREFAEENAGREIEDYRRRAAQVTMERGLDDERICLDASCSRWIIPWRKRILTGLFLQICYHLGDRFRIEVTTRFRITFIAICQSFDNPRLPVT